MAAQGIPRAQAQTLAADFVAQLMTDVSDANPQAQDITPEQQRQLEEQRQADQRAQQYQPPPPSRMPGAAGWPADSAFSRYGKTLAKPNVQGFFSYEKTGDKLVIHLWKTQEGARSIEHFSGAEVQAVQAAVKSAFGDESWGTWADPQRKNTMDMNYYIEFSLVYISSGQTMTITIEPKSNQSVQ
jgi:hypothetical protein